MTDLMQQARELLAAEYAMAGSTKRADKIIAGFDVAPGTECALCAIAVALRAAPEGFVLVPVEPTPEMVKAAEEAYMPFGDMELAIQMAIAASVQEVKDGE